jgi:hypothetical protein
VKNVSTLKSALVVVGGSIAAMPASALELGELKVHSALGQPLRASISYALGPNEAISDTCVSLVPATASGGLPSIDRASIIVADGVIAITGSAIVREPMVSLRLGIRCQYTPQLIRDYLLFIDPAEPQAAPIAAPTAARVAARPQLAPAPVLRQSAPPRPQPVAREPVASASRYRVQPGDSLSGIVQRIDDRRVGLWTAVNAIFEANPEAFLDNDPNRLKAGAWLTIPSFGADRAPIPAATAAPVQASADPAIPADDGAVYDPFAVSESAVPVEEAPAPREEAVPATEAVVATPVADLRPGDIIAAADNPFVESVVIPDTQLEGPATTSSSPNVPVAVIREPADAGGGGTNWLLWLGGAGIALILGLLLFGRRLFDRFGSTPIAPMAPQRRATDGDTETVEALVEPDAEIDDDAPTAENLALDADLIIGTGLQESTDVDVASDFAFASTTQLDIELTEEMASDDDTAETDIIPPINIEQSSILESEVLPEDDDEYDMSVIVDATQMPDHEDATARDLEAVAVDDDGESLVTGDYTVSQEVDYEILEQDYEDELTATQALNLEIQKAAGDLAARLDEDASSDNETARVPLATVHELDVTAQMAQGDEAAVVDDDDTGLNPTVNMEADDKTVEMTEEQTVELPQKGGKAG